MTIEIKELVIRASVGKTTDETVESDIGADSTARQEIIRSCVEQVLEILKRKKER